ncbi:thiosulfate dehydrogenase [quinone] large subunit [Metabacillus crassostreae]|uniref:DoxX family membrane protein n=1 Tax=Metabacillus crassostreae TaxID=929098 RepID=UPI00195A4966|nr:thiosulfate dehydrogenase [quinone] large subunit [Metabacillus crassostreae]
MRNFLKNSLFIAAAFVLARIYLSYMWLSNAENKIMYDFSIGSMLESQVNSGVLPSWWAGFMKLFVLPNTNLFEALVTVGEFSVGIALLLGVFTRFSAIMGALMNFSFLMTFQATLDLQMLIIHLIIILLAGNAGRIGLDPYIKNHFNKYTRYFNKPQKRKENFA